MSHPLSPQQTVVMVQERISFWDERLPKVTRGGWHLRSWQRYTLRKAEDEVRRRHAYLRTSRRGLDAADLTYAMRELQRARAELQQVKRMVDD